MVPELCGEITTSMVGKKAEAAPPVAPARERRSPFRLNGAALIQRTRAWGLGPKHYHHLLFCEQMLLQQAWRNGVQKGKKEGTPGEATV